MAKEYVEKLSDLMKQITPHLSTKVDLEIKHFFSGAAVYADKRICISLTPAGFALKLPADLRDDLMKEKGAKRLITPLLTAVYQEGCEYHSSVRTRLIRHPQ